MTTIQIKHRETGEVLFTADVDTMWRCIVRAWHSGISLRGADLVKADLRDANLTDANLTDANLTDADLCHANLGHANLSNSDLRQACLGGALWCGATIDGARVVSGALGGPGEILCALTESEWEMISQGRRQT